MADRDVFPETELSSYTGGRDELNESIREDVTPVYETERAQREANYGLEPEAFQRRCSLRLPTPKLGRVSNSFKTPGRIDPLLGLPSSYASPLQRGNISLAFPIISF